MRQTFPRIVDGEAPLNGDPVPIASPFPAHRLSRQHLPVGDEPVQTLASEDTDLDLGHVEPAGVRDAISIKPDVFPHDS